MERLARLLPLRQFGRLRHLRAPRDCALAGATSRAAASGMPLSQHAHAPVSAAGAVRVYRTSSRVVMVGTIDAVCQMIDRCIAEENAGMTGGLFERAA